jgi:hypothetical protein
MQAVGWVYTEESFWIYTQRRKVTVGRFRVEFDERNKLQVSSTTLIYMFFLPKRSKCRKKHMGRDS